MGNAAKNNGCLGPKKREKDVYADLIDLIHEQAQTLELLGEIDAKSLNELVAKIKKKGTIRKLTDHLCSHRSKLSDSVNHNLKIVVQVRNIRNTFVGLFIIDEIVRECQDSKGAEYASYEEDDFAPTSPISPTKTASQRQMQRTDSINFEAVGKGAIGIKFQASYFKFVLQMLKFEQLLYVKILESIDAFCFTRKEKLTCKSEVSKVIDIIMQHLKSDKKVDEGSRTYFNLISLTKQGLKNQYVNDNDLMLFISLWLKDKEKLVEAPQLEGEQIEGEQSQYELIIREIIVRCISSWNLTKIIFQTLLVVYDEDKFTGFRVMEIQSLFLRTVGENDLHFQIFRNLFIYLIEYLSDPEINNKKATQDVAMESFQHPKYLHFSEQTTKLNGFETLRRWQEQKYVNLDELISYNCQVLVKAYILNISSDEQFGKQITQEFLKMNAIISQKSNFLIINLLLEEIRWDLTREQLKGIMITLVRQILENCKLTEVPTSDFAAFFLPIGHHFTPESRIQFIQLTGFVVRNLDLSDLVKEIDSNNMSVCLCEFLYSIYEALLIINAEDKISDCLLYTKTINAFLKGLCQKQLFGFVSAFLKALKNKITNNGQNSSLISTYLQLDIFYEGISLLDSAQQIPDVLIALNTEITHSSQGKQIESKIGTVISELATGPSSKHPRNLHKINFEDINKAANISPRYDKEVTAVFDLYFKSANKEQQGNQEVSPYRKSQFSVRTINNQFYNSIQSKNPFEIDESFKNVFGGINDM